MYGEGLSVVHGLCVLASFGIGVLVGGVCL